MSQYLWKYYLEDDIDNFRQLLATATFSGAYTRTSLANASSSAIAGSPGRTLSTSPALKSKGKGSRQSAGITLTRAELNSRDSHGLTLLHHMASSSAENASDFALALLQAPMIDLYVQDQESGWTSLHRALYFGNITIARALMARDFEDAVTAHAGAHAGGLIKIKDKEGNSPFDVYGTTIAPRVLPHRIDQSALSARSAGQNADVSSEETDDDEYGYPNQTVFDPASAIDGDEFYFFGSNKNFNLGFGDEDDRQFPERPPLKRPLPLIRKFYREHLASLTENASIRSSASSELSTPDNMPALVQFRPTNVFDVQLAKFHSAVLTMDPESNLYMCGYGSAGRLGTGDTQTRFSFTPIGGGGLASRKITAIGLGQDHSLAVTDNGEIHSWGSNVYGQLGYALATESLRDEDQIQLIPRQIFGPLKRETVIGCAASRTHSIVHTGASLYTFGKNEGQLGLVDADARSLEIQVVPRKVAASLFSSSIVMVSAIDKATICLLENHEVWVFANYGYSRVQFDLDNFSFQLAKNSFFGARRSGLSNHVVKICSGGSSICALSSEGAVFTVSLKSESSAPDASTTNPAKIRGALSKPQELWSLRKSHMAAIDVDVGQDGSVIICTAAGSVWRREKRAKIKDTSTAGGHVKDYKFSRVPGLTRTAAVRSNAFGAFATVRKDCDVLRKQIPVEPSNLWRDVFSLLPFRDLASTEDSETEEPMPRFWMPKKDSYSPALIRWSIVKSKAIDSDIQGSISKLSETDLATCDVEVGTSLSEVRIPCHAFLLAARSEPLRTGLQRFSQEYFYSIADVLSIEYDRKGQAVILFQGIDILTLLNIIFYVYTDGIIDVWQFTRQAPTMAYAYREVRTEVMKVAGQLELKGLERAARLMSEPSKQLHKDLDRVITNADFFETGDVEIELDGDNRKVHGALICQRCPFFDSLFNGRAGGGWLSSRREELDGPSELIKVDLKHVDPLVFDLVLRYLYADVGVDIFEDAKASDLDTFLDLVLDVMAIANELMLDRLAQVCQDVLGKHVTARNVCQLLNAVGPCSVTGFRNAALEYICLNLEGMLENRLLDELNDDLMEDLNEMIRQNQLNTLPIVKSGRAEDELLDRHPELLDLLNRSRQRKIDSMTLQSRLHEDEARAGKLSRAAGKSPVLGAKSPAFVARKSPSDLVFDMEDDSGISSSSYKGTMSPQLESQELAQGHDTWQLRTPPSSRGRTPSSHWDKGSRAASPSPVIGSVSALNLPTSLGDQRSLGQLHYSAPDTAAPWASASFNADKLDMKQIMAQASEVRQSNISKAISGASNDSTVKSVPGGKLSQKERKRQQQKQRQQATTSQQLAPTSPAATPSQGYSQPKQSPWQLAPVGPKVSLTEIFGGPKEPPPPSPSASKSRRSPSLTLRQTVPGNITTQRKASYQTTTSAPSQPPQQPKRNVSQPIASASSSATTIPSGPTPIPSASTSSLTTPRSIKHDPTSAEPTLQLTMADILAQQQSEKDILKEVAAKRSLIEIQEEQAFQEWWNQEEKATKARMEAEEAAKVRNEKGGRGSRGRRGRRGGSAAAGSKGKAKEQGGGSKEGGDPASREASSVPVGQTVTGISRGGASKRGRRGGGAGASGNAAA